MLATFRTLQRLAQYETSLAPRSRREIRRWAKLAATISDAPLRAHATNSIAIDRRNAEAVAAFAAIAPRRYRPATVDLLTTFQVLVDYVDVLGESVCAARIEDGLHLATALAAAVARPGAPIDAASCIDDDGYLAQLIVASSDLFWQLPAAATVEQTACAAADRCGAALAHSHTAGHTSDHAQLRRWTAVQPAIDGYAWWEVAAAGNSSIAALALLAAAADPAMTDRDAAQISAAYWPHVCVLSTLLDSLVDYERDEASGDFSFVSYYPDAAAAGRGIAAAARCSLRAVRTLPHSHAHTMIVCGVAAYYAAAAEPGSLASRVIPSVLDELRPAMGPIAAVLRAQRRLAGR